MAKKQIYIPLAFHLFIFFISLLLLIISINKLSPSAALAPILVCSLTTALVAFQILLDISNWRSGSTSSNSTEESIEEQNPKTRSVWLMLSLTVVYYVLMMSLGFFVSTILFLLIVPYLYNYKNKIFIIGNCICFVLVYWIGFSMLLNVRLPKGILF